jgi:hypothetical protein
VKINFSQMFETILEVGDAGGIKLVTGLHSGNLGDVIYSLPTIKELGINHLILNACADPSFGGRVLRVDDCKALAPHLLGEAGIAKVSVFATNIPFEYADVREFGVDYNLDSFRRSFPDPGLHLVYQHALQFGITPKTDGPWLTKRHPTSIKEKYVALAVTPRYRRFSDSYYEQLLADIPPENIWIIGTPADRGRLSMCHGNWVYTKDFSQIFSLIQNCALFVGNPSFPYAIAEAMKVPRLVELPEVPNVYPLDDSGHNLNMYSPIKASEMIKSFLSLERSLADKFDSLSASYERLEEENRLRGYALEESKKELQKIKGAFGWRLIGLLNKLRPKNIKKRLLGA